MFYVINVSLRVTSCSEKVECVGVRSGRCGREERGMGLRKDEKESKRERASSTL